MTTRLAAIACCLLLLLGSRVAAQEDAEALQDEVRARLERALGSADAAAAADELWSACILAHGAIEPMIVEVRERIAAQADDDAARDELARFGARLLRRLGDIPAARELLESIPVERERADDVLAKAEVLDASGENEAAVASYDRLLEFELDAETRNTILLRRALMSAEEKGAKKGDGLVEFARSEGRAAALRNRAAIILALMNRQKDAIELFVVEGEGTARFRQEVRLTEWAIEAEEWEAAQRHGWAAVEAAKLTRDRRYALTLLVETYRRAEELDALADTIAGRESELADDVRRIWIDVLRELGRVDDALDLFRNSAEGRFTVEMRRELLELCRETGRDDVMVEAYGEMVRSEPRFIEWREGLSRFHLERGDREEAVAVWNDYLEATSERRYVMAAAATLADIGLDELAIAFARALVARGPDERNQALLFIFETKKERGELEESGSALEELSAAADARDPVRKDISEAWARLGNQRKAADELRAFREARGHGADPESEMKLALVLSELGEEDEALEIWQEVWRVVDSVPRRRYVEDRMMNVASRLGRLAEIAVDIEKKLVAGTADELESGLLVRLYTKVNDAVSATEVIDEFMGETADTAKRIAVLTEKARVFMSCSDFYNYELTIEELIEIDAEGRPDYLRQLAMSNLERGQRAAARKLLEQIKLEEKSSSADEFEAGVLQLAGMREEALAAYRKGLAKYPDRIDGYLLLSNVQKELGRHDRSAGMFQNLAATAAKDDLFTIAVDGILNMRDGRANRGAPDSLIEWARRVTLERLAGKPDKLYLHQLVADLSQEIDDQGMAVRALKSALPIAGEQRSALLRELMSLTAPGGNRRPGIVIGGRARPIKDVEIDPDHLMFGRRLLGQGDLVPPDVYLELGGAFLASREVVNAMRTFNQARVLAEFADMQPDIAAAFERAGFPREALRTYERILTVTPSDLGLLVKVAELQEQLGRDDVAIELYLRGIEVSRRLAPVTVVKGQDDEDDSDPFSFWTRQRNVDETQRQFVWLVRGLRATLDPGKPFTDWAARQVAAVDEELARTVKDGAARGEALDEHPRLELTSRLLRECCLAFSRVDLVDPVDDRLLAAYPEDGALLEKLIRFRLERGYQLSARGLLARATVPDERRASMRLLLGLATRDEIPGLVRPADATALLLPLLAESKTEEVRAMLQRLDLSIGTEEDLERIPMLLSAAIHIDDRDVALALCRHWLNVMVKHSKGGDIYGQVQQLISKSKMALDPPQLKSLVHQIIERVVEDPDKFSVFIQRLPDLEKSVGGGIVTNEQVKKLIEKRLEANDRFIWGIPELIAMLPAEEWSSIVRGTWPKIAKTQHAFFVVRLLPKLEKKVDRAFADFLVAGFKKGFENADNKSIFKHYVDDVTSTPDVNADLVVRILDVLVADEGGLNFRAARAIAKRDMGAPDARDEIEKVYRELVAWTGGRDFLIDNAIRDIEDDFARNDELRVLLDIFAELSADDGGTKELANRRADLARRHRTDAEYIGLLTTATETYPDDKKLMNRLASAHRARGAAFAAIDVEAGFLENNADDDGLRSTHAKRWRSILNPVRALAALAAVDEEEKKNEETADDESLKRERVQPPTIARVEELLDAERAAEAFAEFRRLWRVFPDRTDRYYEWSYQSARNRRHVWPAEKKDEAPEAGERVPNRRGLPARFRGESDADEEKKDDAKPRGAAEVLVERGGGDEIGRLLRSFDPGMFGGALANDVYASLAAAESEAAGGDAPALEALLEIERSGAAGRGVYGKIFALLERLTDAEAASSPDRAEGDLDRTLGALMANVNAGDREQLLRLARLYARLGQQELAGTLYRWCVTLPPSESSTGIVIFNGPTTAGSALVKEVLDLLDGDIRESTIELILRLSDPGADSYWSRDPYEMLVLDTWIELVGHEKAVARTRHILDNLHVSSGYPKRRTATKAARLLARAGRVDEAIRALELAMCKLEPPADLEYAFFRRNYERPGRLGDAEIDTLFDITLDSPPLPDAWLIAAGRAVAAWAGEERCTEETAFRILTVLATRLFARGDETAARECVDAATGLAGENANRLLWLADAWRLMGRDEPADAIEMALLTENRLVVDRIPEVIARVAASDPGRALEIGEAALTWTLHTDLTAALLRSARALGDDERVTAIEARIAEAAAAEAELQRRDEEASGKDSKTTMPAVRIR